jgi:hypothetical protein
MRPLSFFPTHCIQRHLARPFVIIVCQTFWHTVTHRGADIMCSRPVPDNSPLNYLVTISCTFFPRTPLAHIRGPVSCLTVRTMASLSLFFGISQQHLNLPLPTIPLCTTNCASVSLAFLCVCACSVTTAVLFVFVFTYVLSCILHFFNCTILFPSIHTSV